MSNREHSDGSPANLQAAPQPAAPILPAGKAAPSGARVRGERDSDNALTSRIERGEAAVGAGKRGAGRSRESNEALPQVLEAAERSTSYTKPAPLPLPPSPAPVTGVKPWLAPGDLNAGSVPDLGALTGESSSYTLPPVPELPDMDEDEDEDEDGEAREHKAASTPARAPSWLDLQVRPWLFTALLAATCLAVGMVLGALIFGNPGSLP